MTYKRGLIIKRTCNKRGLVIKEDLYKIGWTESGRAVKQGRIFKNEGLYARSN